MLLRISLLAQRTEPLPPPPFIFDLILSLIFVWVGWKAWKKGRGWRSGALLLWLLALGGFYTGVRGIMVG